MVLTREEINNLTVVDFVHDNIGNNYVVVATENGKIKVRLWEPILKIISKE